MSTYLNVPYKQREAARDLGARWDADAKKWYVPAGKDTAPFAEWLPDEVLKATSFTSQAPAAAPAKPAADEPTKGIPLSELLRTIGAAVRQAFPRTVWVTADVVQVKKSPKGHLYLSLGDENCKANGLIWANDVERVVGSFERDSGMRLADGMKLLMQVAVDYKPEHGLGLTIRGIDPSYSLGDLEARRRKILATLTTEGVIGNNKALPAPYDFNRVLVVSPHDAAGLGDFEADARRLEELGLCRFTYRHARFQGDGAANEIRRQVAEGVLLDRFDAVVILRGGGAVNDLAWLDNLELTRDLATLPVPVITGIGHERDHTTLDDVAHTSCDTPSKVVAHIFKVIQLRANEARDTLQELAALAQQIRQQAREQCSTLGHEIEMLARQRIVEGREAVRATFEPVERGSREAISQARELTNELYRGIGARTGVLSTQARALATSELQGLQAAAAAVVARARHEVALATPDLTIPVRLLAQTRLACDQALEQVRTDALKAVETARAATQREAADFESRAREQIAQSRAAVSREAADLQRSALDQVARARSEVDASIREVLAQGPQRTLQRGFTIVRDADRRPITSAAALHEGEAVLIEFQDGEVAVEPSPSPTQRIRPS